MSRPTSLEDRQALSISHLLATTFRFRLPEIQDQAHHAASVTSHAQAGLGGGGEFREGMEGEERECEYQLSFDQLRQTSCQGMQCMDASCARTDSSSMCLIRLPHKVFAIAQESARRMKHWYDGGHSSGDQKRVTGARS